MFCKKENNRGFSFVELVISILIIAILIAAVFYARNLIKKSYIVSAQSLTKSSPVNSIKDLSLWLETSLSDSFSSDVEDGVNIESWIDIKSYGLKISIKAPSSLNQPVYSNTISNIPAVAFDGTNSYLQFNGDFLNNSNYTVFVLEKRKSDKSSNYFFGDSTITNENRNIILGYKLEGTVIHSHAGSNSYNSSVSIYKNSVDSPRIFSFVFDSSVGKKTYINGYLAGQDSNKSALNNISNLVIGKKYEGEIGEIIIFNRALKSSEREDIEKYLGKKWSIAVVPSAECNGTVGSNGCIEGNCSSTILGVAETINASNGESGSASCSTSGYTGTASYSCSSTILNVTSPCSCASGYSKISGTCVKKCSVSVTGVTTPTSVDMGSGNLSCDTTNHYAGTFAYNCASGNTITGSCACETGYTGTTCSSCDTANGYQMISGTCQKSCSITGQNGVTNTTVLSGSTSTSCNTAVGYYGSFTYTCSNGTLSNIVNNCKIDCTGGTIKKSNGKTIHTFTTSGTFNCPEAKTARVLVVGGGGGGGSVSDGNSGGGGGGGGVVYNDNYAISSSTNYTITVAASAGVTTTGNNSSVSLASTPVIIAYGGGRGVMYAPTTTNGASGGGAASNTTIVGTGMPGQGNNGGRSYAGSTPQTSYSGGGGGACEVGGNASAGWGGNGGNGCPIDIDGDGVSVYYGGGGGGGNHGNITGGITDNGLGGLGGGAGRNTGNATATPNTGGGGSGGFAVASGASGIIIIAY